ARGRRAGQAGLLRQRQPGARRAGRRALGSAGRTPYRAGSDRAPLPGSHQRVARGKSMNILIPFAGLSALPWKNGGGSTTTIAVGPPEAGFDDFDWRVSLATISEDGPFSRFPGVDRTLALVDGHGMTLDIDGSERVIICES